MKKTTYLATTEHSEGVSIYEVTCSEEITTIKLTGSTQLEPDYHSTLILEGNGNSTLSWKHGLGEGSVELPSGAVFDLLPMLLILQSEDRNIWGTTHFFKELAFTIGEKK